MDSAGVTGAYTSIAIGADGLPVISYQDATNGDLKAAHCADPACSGALVTTLDSAGDVGLYTSITVGVDRLPVISYRDGATGALKVAHCIDAACTGAALSKVDAAGGAEGRNAIATSITIGADGLPVIAYAGGGNYDLKVAHCANAFCTPFFRRR